MGEMFIAFFEWFEDLPVIMSETFDVIIDAMLTALSIILILLTLPLTIPLFAYWYFFVRRESDEIR